VLSSVEADRSLYIEPYCEHLPQCLSHSILHRLVGNTADRPLPYLVPSSPVLGHFRGNNWLYEHPARAWSFHAHGQEVLVDTEALRTGGPHLGLMMDVDVSLNEMRTGRLNPIHRTREHYDP
jgi:hypothetical protein